jgi:hypothetical protein
MTFVKETPAAERSTGDVQDGLGVGHGVGVGSAAAYPVPRGDRGVDGRFSYGLALDVCVVLARHGYPQVRSGVDLVRVQQALFALIYG